MRLHLASRLTLAAVFAILSIPAFSQVVPAASEGGLPLIVGGGFSNFDLDYGKDNGNTRRMEGGTIWANWTLYNAPSLLRGIGIEIEGRDINYGRPATLPKMRQDVGEGGVIYPWRHYRNFKPYGKFLIGMGSIDFPSNNPKYTHDTRAVYSPGGGLEYRVWRNVWVRADYEYEFWLHLFGPNALNPNGYTIGASYDFRRFHSH